MWKETSFFSAHPNLWIFKLLNWKCLEGTDSKKKMILYSSFNRRAWKNAKLNFQHLPSTQFREKCLSATVSVLLFFSKGTNTVRSSESYNFPCFLPSTSSMNSVPRSPIVMQVGIWKLHNSEHIGKVGTETIQLRLQLAADCRSLVKPL